MHLYIDGLASSERKVFDFKHRFQNWLSDRHAGFVLTGNFDFNNWQDLQNIFTQIISSEPNSDNCTVTICCHGEPNGLKANNNTELIKWQMLVPFFIKLKKNFPKLIIILCVCEGASIGQVNENEPFIFGFTFKIPFQLALETASSIVIDYTSGVAINEILKNAGEHVRNNYDFIKFN